MNAELSTLRSFVLPGGMPAAAALHLARTICRRAERRVVELAEKPDEIVSAEAVRYLNRLSDLLFVASRYINDKGALDVLWVPGRIAEATMFLPLHDGVPLKNMKTPFATRTVLIACIVLYVLTFHGPISADAMVAGLGLIPAVLFGTEILPEGFPFVPVELTLATNIFLHGSLFHLIGNMLFLWVFGDNVEDAMGHWRFLVFFVVCGCAASLTHVLIEPDSHRPLIGASGAISGIVAAYLILYPRVRIWGLFLKGIPLRLPAYWAIGFWFVLQFASAFFSADDGVGWFAHIGGFVAGAVLIPFMRYRYDPLLARVEAHEMHAPR